MNDIRLFEPTLGSLIKIPGKLGVYRVEYMYIEQWTQGDDNHLGLRLAVDRLEENGLAPKLIGDKTVENTWYECPDCLADFTSNDIFCPKCGNKIVWSENDL